MMTVLFGAHVSAICALCLFIIWTWCAPARLSQHWPVGELGTWEGCLVGSRGRRFPQGRHAVWRLKSGHLLLPLVIKGLRFSCRGKIRFNRIWKIYSRTQVFKMLSFNIHSSMFWKSWLSSFSPVFLLYFFSTTCPLSLMWCPIFIFSIPLSESFTAWCVSLIWENRIKPS